LALEELDWTAAMSRTTSKEQQYTLLVLPGMPVEVFISTQARTALSFLTKPLTDQLSRAFREE
jgi:multidrug efflux pump subunit AcrA (membrane-fusion protein)